MNARALIIAAVTIFAVVAVGCGAAQTRSEPVFGEVVAQQPGHFMYPTAETVIVNVNDRAQPLGRLLKNATLLVFLDTSCGSAHAEVMRKNPWINHDITVITVSPVTGGACSFERTCTLESGESAAQVVSLCDAQGILHDAFGVGSDGGVLLLDDRGAVVNRGTLAQFDALRLQSAEVARVSQLDEDDLIRIGWSPHD